MGIDVTYGVRTAERLTDDEFEVEQSAFYARFPDDKEPHQFPSFERDADDPNAIEIQCLDRYYGPVYSRGFWPVIREMGDWLMLRFGEAGEVRYGGDHLGGWDELRPYPEQRAENDLHWSRRGHSPYREACNCDHCAALPTPDSGSSEADHG